MHSNTTNQFLYKQDYYKTYNKQFSTFRKNLDQYLEQQIDLQKDHLQDLDSLSDMDLEGTDQEIITDSSVKVYYQGNTTEIPLEILNLASTKNFMNLDTFKEILDEQEQKELKKLLPQQLNDKEQEETIQKLFSGESFFMNNNPFQDFVENLKKGNFTKIKESEKKIQQQINHQSQKVFYEDLLLDLKEKNNEQNINKLKKRSLKRKAQAVLDCELSDDSQMSEQSLNKIQVDRAFSDMSKGNSTDESEQQDIKEKKSDLQKLNLLIEQFEQTEERIDITQIPYSFQNTAKQILKKYKDDYYKSRQQDNIKLKEKKISLAESDSNIISMNQQQTLLQQQIQSQDQNNKQNSLQSNNLQLQSPQKSQNKQKKIVQQSPLGSQQNLNNQNKLPQATQEQIEEYRKQEKERYQVPTRPWTYTLPGGKKVVVAPVSKKITVSLASKPRDHVLLKPDRLPYITLLCLVRDALAKLPNSEGTRFNICQLIRESQYVYDDVPLEKMTGIVSGALDRLHYMDDPCVKYDLEKKLWVYTHSNRAENYPGWQDGDDTIKLESTKTLKKKRMIENEQQAQRLFQQQKQEQLSIQKKMYEQQQQNKIKFTNINNNNQ